MQVLPHGGTKTISSTQQILTHGGTIKLSTLIHRLIQHSSLSFKSLAERLATKNDVERKIELIDFLNFTRNQFVKLLVIIKWSKSVPSVIQQCWEIHTLLEKQDSYFRDAADSLFFIHGKLQGAKAPIYDIPTAIDVLGTGNYNRLPSIIESPIPLSPVSDTEKKLMITRLNELIHLRLFTSQIPSEFTSITVNNGRAYCTVREVFQAVLTLDGDKLSDPWKILFLDIFAQSSLSGVADSPKLSKKQVLQIKEIIQRKLITSDNPFIDLFNLIQTFCMSFGLYVLYSQASTLAKVKTSSISVGFISVDYLQEKKLTIHYWMQSSVTSSSTSLSKYPSIDISIEDSNTSNSSVSLSIKHYPHLFHPVSGSIVVFSLKPSELNIEQLLLKVQRMHGFIKLYKLYTILLNANASIASTIVLPNISADSSENVEMHVNLLEEYYLIVFVQSRNGRYSLRLNPSHTHLHVNNDLHFLQSMEDRLERDPKDIVNIVSLLRIRRLMDSYEKIAFGNGLEYSRTIPVRSSKVAHVFPPNTIYIKFGVPFSDYFLSIEFDDISTTCSFYLLATKKQQGSLVNIEQVFPITDITKRTNQYKEQRNVKEQVNKRERDESSNDDNIEIKEVAISKKRKISALLANSDLLSSNDSNSILDSTSIVGVHSIPALIPPHASDARFMIDKELLMEAISAAKKKIAKQSIIEHLELLKIKYKVIKDSSILMFLSSSVLSNNNFFNKNNYNLHLSKHFNIKSASIHLLKDMWEVRIVETETISRLKLMESKLSTMDSNSHVKQQLNSLEDSEYYESSSIGINKISSSRVGVKYDSSKQSLIFSIYSLSLPFSLFVECFNSISYMLDIYFAIHSILEGGDVTSSNKSSKNLKKNLKIRSKSLSIISIYLDTSGYSSSVDITWLKDGYKLIELQHPLIHHLEYMLNSFNLLSFLEVYKRTTPVLSEFSRRFITLQAPIDMNKVEESTRIKVLPGDYTIMPKTQHSVKIMYRNSHSVLISFISDDHVLLEDSGIGLYAYTQVTTSKVSPIGYFQAFGSYTLNSLEKEDEKVPQSPLVSHTPLPTGNNRIFIPHSYLLRFLAKLHDYLGCLYLFRCFTLSLNALEKEMIKKETKQVSGDTTSSFELTFIPISNKLECILYIQHFSFLELKVRHSNESEILDPNTPHFLTFNEIEKLCYFFKERISSPPYTKEQVSSTAFLLTLPIHVLKDFIYLIGMEKQHAQKAIFYPTLCFHTPSGISHERVNSRVYFHVKMNRIGLSVEETQLSAIQLSFEYYYSSPETSMMGSSTGRLEVWNMPPENKLVQTVKNILKQSATNQSLSIGKSDSNSRISQFFVSSAIAALCEQEFVL